MTPYAAKRRVLARDTTPAAAPKLRDEVRSLLAATLGVPAVAGDARFADLGLSSLLGVRFLDALNRRYGLRLGVETLFAHPSADALADRLAVLVAPAPITSPAPADPSPAPDGAIAVIGMAGRFAGADSIAQFWDALCEGRVLTREVPADRWDAARHYDPDPAKADRSVSKWAGFLDGIDRFDAAFFGISPREAAAMDPQHRLFLEQAWLALENAGYPADRLRGAPVGVYVGASGSGYDTLLDAGSRSAQSYTLTGNLVAMLATRIAYALDLRGPALVVDTACSSSLVALDLACDALRRGEAEMALVGGVSLFLDEKPFVAMSRTGMLSPNGRCRSFEAAADGIAVGEAAAAVVLKPLARARADGDRIDAVILATGTNQDGRSNGITAPNPAAQEALLRRVHARAGIDPASLTYVEAHGTGTPLGDPIEAAALAAALGPRPAGAPPCVLGAVKATIGHTAEAAGLAGLIKTVLCLRARTLVPQPGFTAPNPRLSLDAAGLEIATERRPWNAPDGTPRRAGISAFGLSGTNAHVVVQEAPPLPSRHASDDDARPLPLLLSARDPTALTARARALADWLRGPGALVPLADVAATLALGRTHHAWRLGIVAADAADAARRLLASAEAGIEVPMPAADAPVAADTPDACVDAYLRGATPDSSARWPALPPGARRNIDLPGYPFTRGVHWAARRPDAVHPLADADGGPVRRLLPDQPLIADHAVGGTVLLHAALFLEIARLAAARARGTAPTGLRDIVWHRTVAVPPAGMDIRLATEATEGAVACALLAGDATRPAAEARAVFTPAPAPPPLDAAALIAGADRHVTRADLDALDRGDVHLGPSYAGFDALHLARDAALSVIEGDARAGACVLAPRVIDAAIQTAAALLARDDGARPRLRYPAALAALDVLGAPPASGWHILAKRRDAETLDVTVAGRDGAPVLRLAGLVLREAGARPAESDAGASPGAATYVPVWLPSLAPRRAAPTPDAVVLADAADGPAAAGLGGPVIVADDEAGLDRLVAGLPAAPRLIFLDTEGGSPAAPRGALALLALTQALLRHGRAGAAVTLHVVTAGALAVTGRETALRPAAAATLGLAKAIGREMTAWHVIPVDAEAGAPLPVDLAGETGDASGEPVAWRGGMRHAPILSRSDAPAGTAALPRGGVWLLVGGTGRVGRAMARHLARERGARLCLVGRAPLDAVRQALLDELRALGGEAFYHRADACAPDALAGAVAATVAAYGRLDGAVQAAVDPLFAPIERTDPAAFAASLRPKMAGLAALAAATAAHPRVMLAIVSSIGAYAGFPGNVGQASYCAACCFEASFAAALRADGRDVRLVQWGLWNDAGFGADALARLRRQGIHPMRPEDAARDFAALLAAGPPDAVRAALAPAVWTAMGAATPDLAAYVRAAESLHSRRAAAEADTGLPADADAYGRAAAASALAARGMRPEAGETAEAWQRRIGALPRHGRLCAALHAMLTDASARTRAPTREALIARSPALRGPLDLLDRCVAALADVLTGETQGTDVLFPGGSMHLVEAIYRDQPVLAACNDLVARAVRAAAPAQVLEIGAGTGATARAVLAACPPDAPVAYHYTDISPGFVRHGRTSLDDARVRAGVLDIEQDPGAQGYAAGTFDMVLATNVLHATRDIDATLAHAARLLRPHGLLLINEMTLAEDVATLTFGLLDGWWNATDTARRLPHSPLLDLAGWSDALARAGFAPVCAAPAPGYPDAHDSPQTVLLAMKADAAGTAPTADASVATAAAPSTPWAPAGIDAVTALVRARIAAGLDLPPEAIGPDTSFGELGLDSIVAPQIADDIARAAGISLRGTDLYNFSTLRTLAAHVAQQAPAPAAGDAVAQAVPASAATAPAACDDAIAVIGMAGRFPDAPDIAAFWDNVAAGRSAVREIDRFDIAPWYSPTRGEAGRTYAKWAAVIDGHDRFDPLFFAISPAEAEAMDPQQRLLLQAAWHALEDAGCTPARLDGARCGVFVGASANSYAAPAAPSLQTLGGSMAILSARLSYFLNLKGPTFPVDTGCSSSLVALHLACQSLRHGESDVAVAGGVSCNLLAPEIFLYLSDSGMASPSGRCATFDDAADGFVPGEGVGVLILKRLADARRDGDRVHALIRATGINQDGRTSGMTAPSATSQTALEIDVWRGAGIDPATIGLIEAHGTGTRLGDPIEVQALTDAFAAFTPARGFCAIGSVKTNIGHAMAAAGIAGLMKAILALRHRTLPASLHYATPNRHIDFAASPFVVNTATRPWRSDTPRRAAVNSFGFSGTNAHVVVEEAPPEGAPPPPPAGPFVFAVSARDAAALDRRLADLARWLRGAGAGVSPADVAHTLNCRRAHLRARRAFVAWTVADLAAQIEGGPAGTPPPALAETARRYEAGESVAFDDRGRLVDLPLYPFAQERYWHEQVAPPGTAWPPRSVPLIAPDSFLLREHVVAGRHLLPGAAFLELARAACLTDAACRIEAVTWTAPVDAATLTEALTIERLADGGATRCVLRDGAMEHAAARVSPGHAPRPAPLDLAAIAARCPAESAGAALYAAASARGYAYGPAFQVIATLRTGTDEALATLRAPATGGYVLHPALLDGALQAAACTRTEGGTATHVPFALDVFEAYAPLDRACLVHARLTDASPALLRFDVTIADAGGTVLARALGLQARALAAPETLLYAPVWDARPRPTPATSAEAGSVIVLAEDEVFARLRDLLPGRRLIRVGAGDRYDGGADRFRIDPARAEDYARLLAEARPGADAAMVMLWPQATSGGVSASIAALDADTGTRALFLAAQAVLRAPASGVTRLLHVTSGAAEHGLHAAAAAFARSIGRESSRLACAAVLLPSLDTAGLTALAAELDGPLTDAEVRLDGGVRHVRTNGRIAMPARPAEAQGGGVCVITGGAGAIGRAIAHHHARTGARVVLIGRRPAEAVDAATLRATGAEALYLSADVTSPAAMRTALAAARDRFGPITRVVHAAGVLHDGLTAAQDGASFDAVWGPKAIGAAILDHLTRNDPLDAFILFSSTAATLGAAGQASYAAANGFLDGFAEQRRAAGRPGRTLSVAWPLWRTDGMAPPAEITAELDRRLGLLPMPADAGLAALDAALATDVPRVTVLHGRAAQLAAFMAEPASTAPTPATPAPTPSAPDAESHAIALLQAAVGEVIHLPPARIDADEPFEAYGIDSMTIVRINARLEQDIADLPKTLFFEYRTLREVAARLVAHHAAALVPRAAPQTTATALQPRPAPRAPDRAGDDAIAIIGIAGIYPQAPDLDAFWANLAAGRDCITEIPPDRWPLEGFYDPDRERAETSYSKWGGFIDGVDRFDPRFFNISPREADALDPQARKFMEVAWATLEDAGLTRASLFRGDPQPDARLCGVFVGVMYGDYQLFGAEESVRGNLIAPNAAYWNVANRVSHFLDLHGPSMAVDTACSSSLTAIHMACTAIRAGDCTLALAGGVNLTLHPSKHWILSKSGFASTDGRCRSFGAGGDGYVPGEGVGALLLKPLARALADGDRIHAVIRAGAVNHGGRTNGYTVPNPAAQGRLIATALRRAGVTPAEVSYVEAHGTGTALGDPVEIAGLVRAFDGAPAGGCAIGSVKSNIGHLEAAAGIAAVSKVVLQFRAGMLAPSLHAATLNPALGIAGTPFTVQQTAAPWSIPGGGARIACVSSFGAGGANAHLVLEEPPPPAATPAHAGPVVVPLSAATPAALATRALQLADWIDAHPDADYAALARTLQTGREAMRHRLAITAGDARALASALRAWTAGQPPALPCHEGDARAGGTGSPDIAAAWASGAAMDWDAAAPGPRPALSLPTYPFEQRRCWVEVTPRAEVPPPAPVLLGAPTRQGAMTTWPLVLAADDPLVADHVVAGRTVLAGALLLEAARAASGAAVLADIRFLRPLLAEGGARVTLDADGAFTVGADVPAVTGRILRDGTALPDDKPSATAGAAVPHAAIYEALAQGGVAYGPAYRLLDEVRRGDGTATATLRRPPEWPATGWHPGVLDAAFQLCFALLPDGMTGGLLPYAIDRLAIHAPPGRARQIHAHRRDAGPGHVTLDLLMVDEDGAPILSVAGFVARAPRVEAAEAPPLRLLAPDWTVVAAPAASSEAMAERRALILGHARDRGLAAALAASWPAGALSPGADPASLPATDAVIFLGGWHAPSVEDAVESLRALIADLARRDAPPALIVVTGGAEAVAPGETPDPAAAAVAAYAKAAGRELPALALTLLDAAPGADPAALARDVLAAAGSGAGERAVRDGVWWRKDFAAVDLPPAAAMPWRAGGAYVIAGGSGGIGLALARHLAARARARIALIGRRAPDARVDATLAAIARAGGEAVYLRADIADARATRDAVAAAAARHGPPDGAFHLALAMHDARAATLTQAEVAAVLAPKVAGTRTLIDALSAAPPGFLMLFSSSNAHTANPGQSAYAAASAAQDAIGLLPAPFPVKVVDWGFWGESGRVATEAYRRSLGRIGVHPISDAEGFDIIERMAAAPLARIMPLRVNDAVAAALRVRDGGDLAPVRAAAAPLDARAAPMLAAAGARFAGIDAYAASRALAALQSAGMLTRPGETLDPGFAARHGILPAQARLLDAVGDMLGRAGLLDGGAVTPAACTPPAAREADLAARRADWMRTDPEVAPYLDLLDHASAHLPQVLQGATEATDVLFPGGSTHRVEPIYRGNRVVDHFQTVVAEAAAAAVRARLAALPAGATLRVLEVGAGTGGTTAFVLPALAPYAARLRYVFSDIGRGFLDAARTRFAAHGFLETAYLDIERPPADEGMAAGFDIVIAANVLHATRRIDRTLAHLRALCAPRGIVLISEATARQDFNTLTFGLTPGWWLFEDADRRLPHAPLLSAPGWLAALAEAGFSDPRVIAGGAATLQSVLAAVSETPVAVAAPDRPATPSRIPADTAAIETVLRAAVARSLRLAPEEVEPDTSFAEYGADSIISVDLVRDINAALGIELKTTALFNYATVRELAAYVAREHAPAAAQTAPPGGTRERTERLRAIIRKRRAATEPAPDPQTEPAAAPPPASAESRAMPAADGDAALLALLRRLQAGEIGVEEALEMPT